MFINNKYTKLYLTIVQHAKLHPPKSGERHHIIPSSLGGDESDSNLVLLTGRQHFLCHKLLIKMLEGSAKAKMVNAFCYMALTRTNKKLTRRVRACDYDLARKLCKTRIYTAERNRKISEARKGISIPRSDESKRRHRDTLAAKRDAGIGLSTEHCLAIASALRGNRNGVGTVITSAHREKIAAGTAKTYQIIDPTGKTFTIKNLQAWLKTMKCRTCKLREPYKRGPLKGYTIIVLPS